MRLVWSTYVLGTYYKTFVNSLYLNVIFIFRTFSGSIKMHRTSYCYISALSKYKDNHTIANFCKLCVNLQKGYRL